MVFDFQFNVSPVSVSQPINLNDCRLFEANARSWLEFKKASTGSVDPGTYLLDAFPSAFMGCRKEKAVFCQPCLRTWEEGWWRMRAVGKRSGRGSVVILLARFEEATSAAPSMALVLSSVNARLPYCQPPMIALLPVST